MILAVDVGNTSTELALLNEADGIVTDKYRYSSKEHRTADYHKNNIKKFAEAYSISAVIVSSVVPDINGFLDCACKELFDLNPVFVCADLTSGITVKYDNPQKLGTDLIAAAAGAVCKYGAPVIVVDIGTATTFSVVNDKKEYLGGLIAPGPVTSMKALASMTAQLSSVKLEVNNRVIGTNTADCINIGTVTAHAAMIDGMLQRVKESLGMPDVKVIATGGFSKDLLPICEQNLIYDENLIFAGLYQIYKLNL